MKKIFFISLLFILSFSSHSYREECSITYGVYFDYKPYEWIVDGKYHGINIDLIKAISKKTGCEINYVTYPWFTLMDKLKKGEIDVVASSINDDTFEYAVPLPTVFVQYRMLLGRSDAPLIKYISELSDKKVLILQDNVGYAMINKEGVKAKFIFKKTEQEVLKSLADGEGDYGIVDNSAFYLIDKYPTLKVVAGPMFSTLYGFIVRPDSKYYKMLFTAIESLKETRQYYEIINVPLGKKYDKIFHIIFVAVILGIFVFIMVMLWNKSLYREVDKKTKRLNDEIAKHIETESMLQRKTKENNDNIVLLQMVLNAIPETIFALDQNYNVLWQSSNKNGCPFDLIHKEVVKILDNGGARDFAVPDDKDNIWKVLVIDFSYMSSNAFLIVAGDITENLRLRDELFMTTRYSALGEMSAIIAHEINTPLGSALHNSDYLSDFVNKLESSDAEEFSVANSSIEKSLIRIKTIVDELKKYTNKQSKEYGSVDLIECCKSAVGITRFMINKTTSEFSMNISDTPVFIYGNAGQIEQMIINILQNACYALTSKKQKINLTLENKDDCVIISVTDEGVGMNEETVRNACLPYFTTRKEKGGTGLGLSLTARLMKEHNGYIEISSNLSEGTTVKMFFYKGDKI